MFYTFVQRPMGGGYQVDDRLAHYVVVEANSTQHANWRAEKLGITFRYPEPDDETSYECGPIHAWHKADDYDAYTGPCVHATGEMTGMPIHKAFGEEIFEDRPHGIRDLTTAVVHYLDGSVERYRYRPTPKPVESDEYDDL